MPRRFNFQGVCWVQLWPYRHQERLCSGWVAEVGRETLLLFKREGSWRFDAYNLSWYYNEEGEYVHAPFDPIKQPILYTLQDGRFLTRREALQALEGLLLARPEILYQDPKNLYPAG